MLGSKRFLQANRGDGLSKWQQLFLEPDRAPFPLTRIVDDKNVLRGADQLFLRWQRQSNWNRCAPHDSPITNP